MSIPLHVLIVEDSEDDALLLARELQRGGYDPAIERVDTPQAFTAALAGRSWDVVVADYAMPRFSGLDALRMLQETGLDLPFIVVSGTIGEDVAVEAMRAGAHDYVMKGNLARLAPAVRRELREAEMRRARRRAEERLRLLSSAVEQSTEGIAMVDMEGNLLFVNNAFAVMHGYAPEELTGEHLSIFHTLAQMPSVEAASRQTQETGEFSGEIWHARRDGTVFPALMYNSLLRDETGESIGMIGTLRDITERKRAEEALRWRNRQLTALYEIGHDISAILDLPTVLERIATHARDLLAADDSEVYLLEPDGQTLRAIVALGDYADESKAASLRLGEGIVGSVAQSGKAEMVNCAERDPRLVQIPGTLLETHALLCAPLICKGQVMGVMLLARSSGRDLFDQDDLDFLVGLARQAAIAIENARLFAAERQYVTELAHALEQQQELDRLKDEFVQNVSHELRTPLSIARGYIELLDSGELGELQPNQREPVTAIARRVRMLADLVDDLSIILEAEARELEWEQVDLSGLARDSMGDFQIAVEQAGLSLASQIALGLPSLLGDTMHLRRVLDNLLNNAIKFTPAGGHITVRLGRDGENLVLEVEDDGVGIPADQLNCIFERFYQVDGSMSRRYGGTGLGLAMVKEIVEAHGGKIGVESGVGQGSIFTVTLPIAP